MCIEGINTQSHWGVGTGNDLKPKSELVLVCTKKEKKIEAYKIETEIGKIVHLLIHTLVLCFVHNEKNPVNYRDIVFLELSVMIQSPFLLKTLRIKNNWQKRPGKYTDAWKEDSRETPNSMEL